MKTPTPMSRFSFHFKCIKRMFPDNIEELVLHHRKEGYTYNGYSRGVPDDFIRIFQVNDFRITKNKSIGFAFNYINCTPAVTLSAKEGRGGIVYSRPLSLSEFSSELKKFMCELRRIKKENAFDVIYCYLVDRICQPNMHIDKEYKSLVSSHSLITDSFKEAEQQSQKNIDCFEKQITELQELNKKELAASKEQHDLDLLIKERIAFEEKITIARRWVAVRNSKIKELSGIKELERKKLHEEAEKFRLSRDKEQQIESLLGGYSKALVNRFNQNKN